MARETRDGLAITAATQDRFDECVRLWVEAVAARDGRRLDGMAERAASRFGEPVVCWLVAVDSASRLRGFVLVTAAGDNEHPEPPDPAMLSLIAVDPWSRGWEPFGESFEHAVQKRPMQTFLKELGPAARHPAPNSPA